MLKRGKNATREIEVCCETICEEDGDAKCDENERRAGWMPDEGDGEVDVEDSEERSALAVADDEQGGEVDDRGDGGKKRTRPNSFGGVTFSRRVFLGNPAHRP